LFEGDSINPGAALGYVPGGLVGESHVVHAAHLLGLQIYQASLKSASSKK
jgi:hypothetical protein